MDILVIRHGESEANKARVVTGHIDYALTDKGRKQARLVSKWLNEHHDIDRIYTSPLIRALETAKTIADECHIEINVEDDLIDHDAGQLSGLTYDVATKKSKNTKRFPHKSVFEEETKIEYRMRVERVVSKILCDNSSDSTIVVVSHGGTIVQFLRAFMQLPMNTNVSMLTGNTGISHLKLDGDNRKILYANRQEHLL